MNVAEVAALGLVLGPDSAQASAHGAVYYARRLGRIVPELCRCCGAGSAEAHHFDYTRPLDVVWLCRRCHTLVHLLLGKIRQKKSR